MAGSGIWLSIWHVYLSVCLFPNSVIFQERRKAETWTLLCNDWETVENFEQSFRTLKQDHMNKSESFL